MQKSTTCNSKSIFPSFSLAHTYSFTSLIYHVHIKCLELLQLSIFRYGLSIVHSASYINILTHNNKTIMQVESEEKVKEAVQS